MDGKKKFNLFIFKMIPAKIKEIRETKRKKNDEK